MNTSAQGLDLVVLVSGSGSNLQAILDAIQQGRLHARVRRVVSNVAGVRALERARAAHVDVQVLSQQGFSTRAEFDVALLHSVQEAFGDAPAATAYVVLAGFMRILTDAFLSAFPEHVVNIHPSLLPAFPGMRAQLQAIEHGVCVSGCTVHFVDSGTDTGPILAQAAVPVWSDDTEESLTKRILEREHVLLPAVLQSIAEGRVVSGSQRGHRRVRPLDIDPCIVHDSARRSE